MSTRGVSLVVVHIAQNPGSIRKEKSGRVVGGLLDNRLLKLNQLVCRCM